LTFGHARELDRPSELLLARAWAAGAGPASDDLATRNGSTNTARGAQPSRRRIDEEGRTVEHPLACKLGQLVSGSILARPKAAGVQRSSVLRAPRLT